MKHLKLFEDHNEEIFWESIPDREYNKFIDRGIIRFSKQEIDILLKFINEDTDNRKLKMNRYGLLRNSIDFDYNKYIETGKIHDYADERLIVITSSDTSSGGKLYRHFIINKCEDEWFLVEMTGLYFKCDQIDGLLKLLNDLG